MEHEAWNMEQALFHEKLNKLMDEYAHGVYAATKKFPRDEIYGVTSQLRRASLSVMLNYIEGYARKKDKVYKNFLEISFGSLKESKYLLHFSMVEKYMVREDYEYLTTIAEEISKMIWGILRNLK